MSDTSTRLLPQHAALITASGIAPEVAQARGYRSAMTKAELRGLGFAESQSKVPALVVPVYGVTGNIETYQARPDEPRVKDGKALKYETPRGTCMVLDVHPTARPWLGDPNRPLLVTEGVRKADAAVSRGLCCVALLGVWNWRGTNEDGGKVALPDWEMVALDGRQVYIAFDSDVMLKPEVHAALVRLKAFLERRGAAVAVIYLPAAEGGGKQGLDDFLAVGHTVTELLALASPTVREPATEPEAAAVNGGDLRELLERATAKRIHLAHDVVRLPGGRAVLTYGIAVGEGKVLLLNSENRKYAVADAESVIDGDFRLKHANPGPSSVSTDVALGWTTGTAKGSITGALDRLERHLGAHVVLRDPHAALVVASWCLATWCHRTFRVFPYINLRSSERRCGKSRLLKMMSKVTFNGSHETFPTEAAIYRAAAESSPTQLFDEVENLQGHNERFDALVSVLNAGFENGATVPRLEKRGDQYVTMRHEVYCPRALAGIKGLRDTLEDRSIQIFMVRRKRSEPIERITVETDAEAATIRDLCALACLDGFQDIVKSYEGTAAVLVHQVPDLDDRAVDLWSPLLAIALAADAEDDGDRHRRMLAAISAAGQLRDADAEDGPTVRLVGALDRIAAGRDRNMTPTDLMGALKQEPGFEWIKSTKALAGLLNPIGFFRRRVREGQKLTWYYVLEQEALRDLRERYGARGT